MTEERIKELAQDFLDDPTKEDFITANDLTYLIRTVAAEARKEGIEWMIQCAVAEINVMQGTFRDTELLMEVKRRIRENGQAQLAKAEQLREKGE